jgi:hypothetical protein
MLVSANAGRWIEIDLVLSQANGLSTEDLQLLKTIALLNLIDASGALRASPSLLLFALDSPSNNNDVAHKTLLDRLDKLTERGFLVYRQFSDEYRIWQGTDVDLATRISEIRERCDDHAVAKMLSTHLPAAVVAGRHSQRTGMLRYFITTVTDPATEVVNGPAVDDPADGIMIFHFGTEDDVPRVRSSVPAVVGITEKASNVIEVGRQLLSLKELLSADVLDAVARSEIGERAGQTESELAAAMAGAFSPAQTATRWFLLDGTGTENAGQRAVAGNLPLVERSLAGVVSAACEIAYPHTPHIRNEMLGRYQLTSQGAKARRELLTAMLTRSAGARLGIEGYGPERAMYEGVLAYLGLHGPKADDHITDVPLTGWGYTEPADTDTLAPAWRALRAYLAQSNGEHPVDALVRLLMAPPYGVKAGVIPVIIWAAMILSADDMAIFEDGTYQPTLTPELIERLIKAPARYSVKYVPVNEGQRHLVLEKLATELGIDTSTGRPTSYRNPALLVITRQLLDHVRGLTNYATRTRRISDSAISVRQALAAARDPDDLLFTALPEALGLDAIHAVDAPDETSAVRYANGLTGALAEIGEVDAKLRAEVVEILSRELQLPRELPSLRRSLAERSVGFANAVVEPDLRGFIGLALNDSLADEDWLDPVAVRIARAGLASWTDEHPRLFANNARKIGNAFDRLSHLYRAGVDESGATKTSVQLLTLMRHDGNEARVLVQAPKAVRDAASSLAVKVIEEAESELGPGGGRVLAAALATALADRPTADEDPSSEANPYG